MGFYSLLLSKRHIYLFIYLILVLFIVWIYKRPHTNQLDYNLIPFQTITLYWHALKPGSIGISFANVVGNIVLTMPLGYFVFTLVKRPRLWKALAIGLLLSVGIEAGQLVLHLAGISSRSIDVDDLILNGIGSGIGYLLALLCSRKTVYDPLP